MADINIGYEDIVNTQVDDGWLFHIFAFFVVRWYLYWLNHIIIHCLLFCVFVKVVAFNGKPVKNLKSLATMVEACDDEYLKFDLDYDQVHSSSPCLACSCKIGTASFIN